MSKLTAQIWKDQSIADKIAVSKAVGIKVIDDPDILHAFPRDRIKIGRLNAIVETACQGMNHTNSTPQDVVNRYMDAGAVHFMNSPEVFWEGPINEAGGVEDPVFMKWYNEVESLRQTTFYDLGLRACIYNWSAHVRLHHGRKFEPLIPSFELAKKFGNLLGLHGYSSPLLDSYPEYINPHWYIRDALGWIPKVAYTEYGADRAPNENEYDGWRLCMNQPTYLAELIKRSEALDNDPDVLIMCVYIWSGSNGGEEGQDWTMYNLIYGGPKSEDDGATGDLILDYVNAHPSPVIFPVPGDPVPPTPPPDPLPDPDPVDSVDYELLLGGYQRYVDYNFAPDDTTGDRWIPLDEDGIVFFDYVNTKEDIEKLTHVEPFPPADLGYDKPDALRFQNEAEVANIWAVKRVTTKPGDRVVAVCESSCELLNSDADDKLTRFLIVDPKGGVDATDKTLPRDERVDIDLLQYQEVVATAEANSVTVMFRVFSKSGRRFNVDLSKFKVSVVSNNVPPPPPPPPEYWVESITTYNLNLRSSAEYDPEGKNVITVLGEGTKLWKKNVVVNGYSEVRIGNCALGWCSSTPYYWK